MGTFHQKLLIGRADRSAFEEVKALVDTGAAYTWIPSSLLAKLGADPVVKRKFRIADGSTIERPIAELPVRLDGKTVTTLCIFDDEGSEPLLGALTLEQFGLAADPVNRKLVPVILPETRLGLRP